MVGRCSLCVFFFLTSDIIKSLNHVSTCQPLHEKFLTSHTLEALPESPVPTRTRTERGVRILTPSSAIVFWLCCRCGPSLQLLCASVLFPTTFFLAETLFPSRMLGIVLVCFFFSPLLFLVVLSSKLVVCDTREAQQRR